MVLPNSTTQQRWQQKPPMKQQQQQQQQQPPLIQSNPPNQKYMNQKQQNTNNINNAQMSKKQKQSHHNNNSNSNNTNNNNNSMNTPPSSTTVAELPETFGLPSNNQSNTFNSYKTSSSSFNNKNDILLDDRVIPKSNDDVNKESDHVKKNVKSPNSDIEIISEAYPTSNIQSSALNNNNNNNNYNNSRQNQSIQQQQQDELFKQYLAKNYNTILAVTTKPQSNFISNFSCLNQALNQIPSGGFYDNKLKRSKPYSTNIKLKDIDSIYKQLDLELDREDGEEGDEDEEMIEIDDSGNESKKKLKSTKLIVIDDTGDEMHKPWITPELINLIKHRNLLSAKINEKNLMNKDENNGEENTTTTNEADAELLQKFKNLRNKVTKLVKKARSMFLF